MKKSNGVRGSTTRRRRSAKSAIDDLPVLGAKPALQTRLRVLLSKSDRYLEDQGLPPVSGSARHQRQRSALSSGFAKKGQPAASPAFHARLIGEVCDELLTALENGALDDTTIELAIELGRKLSEWEWQHAYGQAIETGRPVYAGSRLGAKLGGRKKAASTRDNLKEMEKLIPKVRSISAAATKLAKGNRKKANALRALWYYHHPRK